MQVKNGAGLPTNNNQGQITEKKEPRLGFGIHARILKFLDLNIIYAKMVPLSSGYQQFVYSENYTLAKKWLRAFSLSREILRTQFLAKVDIGPLISQTCLAAQEYSHDED